ncbi:MAG: NAD-dependent epimerase/dehydratase family protein [Acidimicrobiia bacterium]|nr:NAD-dependent epimerase/dehydratase family protein [Acidimicrobiia bacterium]
MKVAVTGASGFIGSHLTAHLRSHGHTVVGLGRAADGITMAPMGATNETAIGADLRDLLHGVDAVVHLAARQQDSPTTPLADYLQPNVLLTEALLRAARDAGVLRFVAASSRLVYPSRINSPATEDQAGDPDGFYGLSKVIAENLVRLHTTDGTLSGLALRIGQVYGRGDQGRGVLPRFVDDARNGRPPTVAGEGKAVRDFVYVDDVVTAFRLALETDTTAPAINIGGGGHSIRELAIAATQAVGMDEAAIQYTPVADEDTSHYSLNCELASEQLGWSPAGSLVDSIKRYLAATG